jgi:hypothetical protein
MCKGFPPVDQLIGRRLYKIGGMDGVYRIDIPPLLDKDV